MAERLPQSTAKRVVLKAYLSSDHVSAATGKTIPVVISKNGAAFGNPSAGATNATAIASGWYYVDLSTTDTGTAGPLIVRGTEATIDDVEYIYEVVNANNGGFAALPNAAAATAGGLPSSGAGANQIALDPSGRVTAASVAGAVGSVTGAVGSVTGAVGSVTGNVGGNVTGSVGSVTGNVGGNVVGSVASVTADVGITQGGADKVWASAARTLTSFGTLIADIWASATRTLTAVADSSGVTTLLTRIIGTLAAGTHNPQTGDSYARLGAPAHGSIAADIAAISGGGTIYGEGGAITFTYTVYRPDGFTPLPNTAVYVSADSGGTQRSDTKITDDLGRVQFNLDPSTVYFWRSHDDYTFVNPDTEIVSP